MLEPGRTVPLRSETSEARAVTTRRQIISRFAHLLSAQVVEAITSGLFLLYLAWLDSTVYGQVMYAIAAGSIVSKVVQFGLYYCLVRELSVADKTQVPRILSQANVLKFLLMIPSIAAVWALVTLTRLGPQMSWIVVLVCLGFSLEIFADTVFADLRVRGKQDQESRIKMASHVACYGYGFVTSYLGFHPVAVGLFKVVSASVRIFLSVSVLVRDYSGRIAVAPNWADVWGMVKYASVFASIEILQNIYTRTNVFFIESAAGVKGVAYYSATWVIVDGISWVGVEQLVGWVLFPMLALLWNRSNREFSVLITTGFLWLLAAALGIMFLLAVESEFIIRLVYPAEYADAVWMQRYLVWTILLSLIQYFFAHVMIAIGGARPLLVFSCIAMAANLALNMTIVPLLGLLGGCLVIIITKLIMAVFTVLYCQVRFRFFRATDFVFPVGLGVACLAVFLVLDPLLTLHPAVGITAGLYASILWKCGERFMGRLPAGPSSS